MCDLLAVIYKCFAYTNALNASVWSKWDIGASICSDYQKHDSCCFIHHMIIHIVCVISVDILNEFVISFVCSCGSLVNVLYSSYQYFIFSPFFFFSMLFLQVQPFMNSNPQSDYWAWLAFSRYCQSGNYILWTFTSLIYLNFGLMSNYSLLYINIY